MYYNIYQVGEKPIDKKGYITADSFSDHDFIGRIADYVDNVDDRNYEIKMLAEWLAENRLGKVESNILTLNGYMLLSNYFYEKYKEFQKTAQSLCSIDERQFMDFYYTSELVFYLTRNFNNERGIYIYQKDQELITMDEFLRTARVDTPYYIGGVCKYHC